MTGKYTTLYFDLDNTLLDFDKSEKTAIKSVLRKHSLPDGDREAALYSAINKSFWERFERGEIEKSEIFTGRFKKLLQELNADKDPEKMTADYFINLAAGHDVIEGAEDILGWLKQKGYKIYVTTNGVSSTQYKRIAESGLAGYFDAVFVSEEAGCQKPEKAYFDYVTEHTPEKDRTRVLIIGDSQSSDILGGINAGIDTCWFNRGGVAVKYKSAHTITSLDQLKEIL